MSKTYRRTNKGNYKTWIPKESNEYFRTYRCRCSWCLAEKRKKAIDKTHQKEILDFINGVNYNE
jgi:hypothetical protein